MSEETKTQPTRRTICLCGSTRFKWEFERVERQLTLAGCIVLRPGVFGHADGAEPTAEQKRELDELHLRKIDQCTEVFVINPGDYVGTSTLLEVAYAKRTGKPVSYMEHHIKGLERDTLVRMTPRGLGVLRSWGERAALGVDEGTVLRVTTTQLGGHLLGLQTPTGRLVLVPRDLVEEADAAPEPSVKEKVLDRLGKLSEETLGAVTVEEVVDFNQLEKVCPELDEMTMDGNRWCAKPKGFINLQESCVGFGTTPLEATENLAAAMLMHSSMRRAVDSAKKAMESSPKTPIDPLPPSIERFLVEGEPKRPAPIIVLEGPDGSGKTVTAQALKELLLSRGHRVEIVRLPGGTPLGEMLRGPLKSPSFDLSPFEKALLFVAVDEAGHRKAEELAAAGTTVIMDRCALSNIVYRAIQGEREEAKLVRELTVGRGRGWPKGARVFFLDAPDEVLRGRVEGTKKSPDRYDGLWLQAAQEYRQTIRSMGFEVVDTGSMDPASVAQEVARRAVP